MYLLLLVKVMQMLVQSHLAYSSCNSSHFGLCVMHHMCVSQTMSFINCKLIRQVPYVRHVKSNDTSWVWVQLHAIHHTMYLCTYEQRTTWFVNISMISQMTCLLTINSIDETLPRIPRAFSAFSINTILRSPLKKFWITSKVQTPYAYFYDQRGLAARLQNSDGLQKNS